MSQSEEYKETISRMNNTIDRLKDENNSLYKVNIQNQEQNVKNINDLEQL